MTAFTLHWVWLWCGGWTRKEILQPLSVVVLVGCFFYSSNAAGVTRIVRQVWQDFGAEKNTSSPQLAVAEGLI